MTSLLHVDTASNYIYENYDLYNDQDGSASTYKPLELALTEYTPAAAPTLGRMMNVSQVEAVARAAESASVAD